MSVRILSLCMGILATVVALTIPNVESSKAYSSSGMNKCGHLRGSDDAKRVAKQAWSKPYGPKWFDRRNWKKIKRCSRTQYQKEVRFDQIWEKYKRKLSHHRSVLRMKRECGQSPTRAVLRCIDYASHKHQYPVSTLRRIAACESGYNPYARNPSGASGLFQFMPSTFAATPYGHKSIVSAKYNALAAAWKMRNHGTGEWVCQ